MISEAFPYPFPWYYWWMQPIWKMDTLTLLYRVGFEWVLKDFNSSINWLYCHCYRRLFSIEHLLLGLWLKHCPCCAELFNFGSLKWNVKCFLSCKKTDLFSPSWKTGTWIWKHFFFFLAGTWTGAEFSPARLNFLSSSSENTTPWRLVQYKEWNARVPSPETSHFVTCTSMLEGYME